MSEYSQTRIQVRRGTAAQFAAANPVLGVGEPAFETDTNTLKLGDGTTAYSSLSAITGGGGGGGGISNVVEDTTPQLGGNLDVNSRNIIGTGNVALTGSGTFTSIIKTGGTSSQFLKADGSVDSSTYLTDIVNDTTPSLGGELNLDNKDIVIDAKNNDGTQIDAGTPVYIVGYHAGSSKPLIAPADASDSTKMPAIGITNDDIAGSAEGTVGVMGVVDGIDTTSPVSFSIGDVVYVANGGGLTNVKPTTAAHLIQNLGRVTKVNASNGRILLLGAGRVNDIPNSGTFSGNIEAASFIKNGGTSSQFLKADGSVDSSTYLTSYTETDTLATVTGRGATTTTTSVIPFYYANQAAFPNATTYHGAIAHSHSDGAMYFAHGGVWNMLANTEGGAVFNEDGASVDFRVEGDTDTDLFFVDGSADKVGISTNSPDYILHVETTAQDVAGFTNVPTSSPVSSGNIQNLVVQGFGGAGAKGIYLAHYCNESNGSSTQTLKNVIRMGEGIISLDDAYSTGLGTTYYPKLQVNTETGAVTFNNTYTFPTADGSADQVLKTDGAGNLSFGTVPKSDVTGITGAVAVANIVLISQSNYDALSSYDTNTLYHII